jgi:hypothetical protein
MTRKLAGIRGHVCDAAVAAAYYACMDFTRAIGLTPEAAAAVDDAFTYHAWTPDMVARGTQVREALANAVKVIIENVPAGPDRNVAIRKLREARMDANSAITHGGKY